MRMRHLLTFLILLPFVLPIDAIFSQEKPAAIENKTIENKAAENKVADDKAAVVAEPAVNPVVKPAPNPVTKPVAKKPMTKSD